MKPLITVAIPVFNSETTLSTCFESILSQSYTNIEIIVSENCSTDKTSEICDYYASLDHRVTIIHRSNHVSAWLNFASLLNLGQGDFFMWAASDDSWSFDFIERCLNFLLDHPDYVAVSLRR